MNNAAKPNAVTRIVGAALPTLIATAVLSMVAGLVRSLAMKCRAELPQRSRSLASPGSFEHPIDRVTLAMRAVRDLGIHVSMQPGDPLVVTLSNATHRVRVLIRRPDLTLSDSNLWDLRTALYRLERGAPPTERLSSHGAPDDR